jgi:hypothetical protein
MHHLVLQALASSPLDERYRLQIGGKLTRGLGAGGKPEIGLVRDATPFPSPAAGRASSVHSRTAAAPHNQHHQQQQVHSTKGGVPCRTHRNTPMAQHLHQQTSRLALNTLTTIPTAACWQRMHTHVAHTHPPLHTAHTHTHPTRPLTHPTHPATLHTHTHPPHPPLHTHTLTPATRPAGSCPGEPGGCGEGAGWQRHGVCHGEGATAGWAGGGSCREEGGGQEGAGERGVGQDNVRTLGLKRLDCGEAPRQRGVGGARQRPGAPCALYRGPAAAAACGLRK